MSRKLALALAFSFTTASLAATAPAPKVSTSSSDRDLTAQRRPRLTETLTEQFSQGSNEGGWTIGGVEFHFAHGGNKGSYIESRANDTYAPQPRTTAPSGFSGDYRARRVLAVGVDLITLRVDFSAAERPLSVLLTSDPGTPEDPFDDCTAYLLGTEFAPEPGQGWRSYSFAVPSDSETLPEGWGILEGCPEATPDAAWNRVIQDVDELRYFFGDPTFFFIFQQWNTGIDNPSITWKLQ